LQYAVKILCGPSGYRELPSATSKSAVKPDSRVAPGTYFTAINIHNPTDKAVALRFKVAVASPGKSGPVSRFFDLKVGPDEALSIDCAQFYEYFHAKPEFTDGFTVIESEAELDVVAVYTAAGATGRVETLKTERVLPRLQQ